MTDNPQPSEVYRCPHWELRPRERLLLVHGQPADIKGRAFDLLVALARRLGRPATKRELIDEVWDGVVVEENNLSVQVSALRKLLGPEAVATIDRVGYQLVVPMLQAPGADAGHAAPAPAHPGRAAQPAIHGRRADLEAIAPLIGAVPLLTIVGTGGVGKTTLARAALQAHGGTWRDGVHWIDLAPLHAGERLLPRVAQALGVQAGDHQAPSEDLQRALRLQQALVVLDNCEHLLDELALLLGPLLRGDTALRWLATSQEPLRLPGETVYRLGPLDVPPPGTACADALRFGAVALLCDRARAADHRFTLDEAQIGVAIDLCRDLDGLPLALEMAAARVASLGLQSVRSQLGQRLRLGTGHRNAPPRHQTLRHTYEWSHGLMSPLEQTVFRRLEPFVGGFTAPMAQALCCSPGDDLPPLEPWDLLDALSALVDKSLVQRAAGAGAGAGGGGGGGGGGERLLLLESARDFARLQLDASGERAAVHRRHAQVVAQFFDPAQHELETWRDRDWSDKYLPERSNVAAALAWACGAGDPELLARLVTALAQLDAMTYTESEVVQRNLPPGLLMQAPPAWRARACLELGWAHFLDGQRELGTELALQALHDFEALGDEVGCYIACLRLFRLYEGRPGMEAPARAMQARLAQADTSRIPLRWRITHDSTVALPQAPQRRVDQLRALLTAAERAGLDAQAAVCRMRITDELLVSGRLTEAADTASALLQAGEALPRVRAVIQINLAQALLRLGRNADALAVALAVMRTLPGYVHLVLDIAAQVALAQGQADEAALFSGGSTRIRKQRGLQADASEVVIIEATRLQLLQCKNSDQLAALMAQGAAMPVDDLLRLLPVPSA